MSSTSPDIKTREGQERLRAKGVRPVPEPDDLTRPYWDAAARSELRIQRCQKCGFLQHPPSPTCKHCDAPEMEWKQVSGKGTVYTFIVDHRLMVPGFDEPYVVAQVNPDETQDDTVRIVANIKHCAPEDVYIGMPVEVCFEQVNGVVLPQFRPRT